MTPIHKPLRRARVAPAFVSSLVFLLALLPAVFPLALLPALLRSAITHIGGFLLIALELVINLKT